MKFDIDCVNPMLVGSMKLLKAEDTPEHRKLFMDELVKATFLSPTCIEPEPTVDENGETVIMQGAKVQFPMLNTKDKKSYYVLYTDKQSLQEAEEIDNGTPERFRSHVAAVTVDEIGGLLATVGPQGQVNPAQGAIINPYSDSLIVGREMLIGYFKSKMEFMKAKADQERREMEDPKKVIPFPGNRQE